jgi:hypothetical protein
MSLNLGRRNGQHARDSNVDADRDGATARDDGGVLPPGGADGDGVIGSGALAARRPVPLWAVFSAGLSPLVLTVGWLVAGAVQPTSYSPVRETVSVMAGYDGTDRWIMTGAMLAAGACYLMTAAGLASLRAPARFALLLAGLCSIGVAASPEPASGPGLVHLTWTVIGAVTITVWPLIVGWRAVPPWAAVHPRAVAVATASFVVLLVWVTLEVHGGDALGAAERATTSIPTIWPFVVALSLRRHGGREVAWISQEES